MNPFVWKVRVYWEDTDAGGVVYHSRYLNFFERARTEWLRSIGIYQAKIASEDNVLFAIRNMDIDFVQAARLDDELDITVHSVNAGGVRMTLSQDVTRCCDRQSGGNRQYDCCLSDRRQLQTNPYAQMDQGGDKQCKMTYKSGS